MNDVTEGYGPELMVLEPMRPTIEVHLQKRGPSSKPIGKITVFQHDGQGHVTWEDRPFVIDAERGRVVVAAPEKPLPMP